MNYKPQITYLFDPLCGWCYGASRILAELATSPDLAIGLAPVGLFSGEGARQVDAHFAAYAWSHDQRIASITGQSFTGQYRRNVLGKLGSSLDSGPANLALTAVALTDPSRELDALRLIQEARYVLGRDVTDLRELVDILIHRGLGVAANRLGVPDQELLTENHRRVEAGRTAMQGFRVDGVPALIVDDRQSRRLVLANELFSDPELLNTLTGSGRPSAGPNLQPVA
jgi:putative protein-disulfide isomerase